MIMSYGRAHNVFIFVSTFQIALLLEYCSRGDLKSLLSDHRKEFQNCLSHFYKTGELELVNALKLGGLRVDIKLFFQWSLQVRISE